MKLISFKGYYKINNNISYTYLIRESISNDLFYNMELRKAKVLKSLLNLNGIDKVFFSNSKNCVVALFIEYLKKCCLYLKNK